MLFDFLYIDATGYWLHLGDFYSSSSCLEVFQIHDERSKHLVKPWMKVTEAMQNNHFQYLHVYFILFQFEASMHHHSLQLLVFLVPFHLVLTSLHQPLVHRYIKQVNPDRHSDRLLNSRFCWLGVSSMSSMLFSGRKQIVRDHGLNRIIVICIFWCHFLEVSMISVVGIKLHRIWRPEISDETQLIARSPQKLRNQLPPLSSQEH